MRKIYFLILSSLIIFILTAPVFAQRIIEEDTRFQMGEQDIAFRDTVGFSGTTRIGNIAETAIQAFLGLLAIIFIILIIVAGYNWMTAAGDESKVTKAKDSIKRAIIGLIITVSAYAITYFVFSYIDWVGTGGGGPVSG